MCPQYDYLCDNCDMPHSIRESITEHDPYKTILCEHCKEGYLERIIVAPLHIEFKGEGWTPKGK